MNARMPEEFYELAVVHLPEESVPGAAGGRRRIEHYTVLKVIWFVLVTGCRWKDVPRELGCCGETARMRLKAWEEAGIWDTIHQTFLALLRQKNKLDMHTAIIDSTQVRAFGGGELTGPSPVDRRKTGTKYTLLVDRHGVPLVIQTAPANTSDQRQILSTTVAFPQVGGKPGRPKTHPDKLYADAGYDSDATRCILRFLGIEPHIRRKNSSHGSHLGKIRWVVERTISWVKGLRRMRIRYDRLGTMIDAWTTMAAAVVCFQMIQESVP
jgi:transposase